MLMHGVSPRPTVAIARYNWQQRLKPMTRAVPFRRCRRSSTTNVARSAPREPIRRHDSTRSPRPMRCAWWCAGFVGDRVGPAGTAPYPERRQIGGAPCRIACAGTSRRAHAAECTRGGTGSRRQTGGAAGPRLRDARVHGKGDASGTRAVLRPDAGAWRLCRRGALGALGA